MPENEYKYLDHAGLSRFKGKIQDILDTKVDKENGKYIVTVDSELSTTSTNPVQNKVVAGKLGDTDISSIGDGSVTGAISSLNTDLTTLKYHSAGNNPDFNNLTDPGFWYFGDTSSATHAPSTQHGWLFMLVIASDNSNMIVQIVFGGRTSSGSSHRIWVRYRNSGTWNSTWDEYTNRTELDTLNTGTVGIRNNIPRYDSVDFNNFETTGIYYLGNNLQNSPNTGGYLMLIVLKPNVVTSDIIQEAISMTERTVYFRRKSSNGWTEWTTMPTRSEIDTLNTNINTVQLYTPTYVQNSYIAENEMTIRIRRVGRLGLLYFNAYITNMPKSTGYITIATFSLGSHTPYVTTSSVVAGQKDRSVIVQLDMTGKVNIYNDNSETIIGRYQQIIPFWTE